jgi:small subunit ribosomal protein S6
MFLLDPALASDWPAAEAEVKRILDRAGAEVTGIRNWDERKLAYEMSGHKRGLYALSLFKAPPDSITGIERDVQLSEKVVRVLVINREKLTPDALQRHLTMGPPPKTLSRGGDEWGSSDRGGDRGGDRGPRRERRFEPAPAEGSDVGGAATAVKDEAEGAGEDIE